MKIAEVIATNIQNLLDERKVSVSEISNMLGVSRQTMTNYLKGASIIDSVQLSKIADFFNIAISELFVDSSNNKPEIIFRTALNHSEAVVTIQDIVYERLEKYSSLANSLNKKTSYFPEQYNLTLCLSNQEIDINYECQNYFDPKYKINNILKNEIMQIAYDQRKILGLGNNGAISLISALTRRGINVIFLDMGENDVFGLSICDETKGCFIFVNSNPTITIERQLFTLAHEYGHIILHRPIYKRKLNNKAIGRTNLLDQMADHFAGCLLCPESLIAPYANILHSIRNDLDAICRFLIPLKQSLHVSFQAALLSCKNYGYISYNAVSEFYRITENNNAKKEEPHPIKNNAELYASFKYECNLAIIEMVHNIYSKDLMSKEEVEKALKEFNVPDDEINNLISKWNEVKSYGIDSFLNNQQA